MSKEIKVRSYSIHFILFGIIALIVLTAITLLIFILPPAMQCGWKCPIPTEPAEFQFSWIKTIIAFTIILGGVIFLIKTPLWGKLTERERIILKQIYEAKDKNLKIYGIAKTTRKNKGDKLGVTHGNQFYRIIYRFEKWGMVKIDAQGIVHITEWGKSFILR